MRFASVRNAVKSFIENLPFMKNEQTDGATANRKFPDPHVTQLFDHDFTESVKSFLSILEPIAKLFNVCQKSYLWPMRSKSGWICCKMDQKN